jgi:hypothetical protein
LLLIDSGEATDGPLPLNCCAIAYWRMRSFDALLDALLMVIAKRLSAASHRYAAD